MVNYPLILLKVSSVNYFCFKLHLRFLANRLRKILTQVFMLFPLIQMLIIQGSKEAYSIEHKKLTFQVLTKNFR